MRRLLALFVATSALAFSAATAAAEPSLTAIGRSIGAIRLGMAEADVVQVYGKPRKVEHIELADGGSARLASYRRHGGGFRITYGTGGTVSHVSIVRPEYFDC